MWRKTGKPRPHASSASEEMFHLLVSSIRDYAIFMLDPEGRVVTWNDGAERIKGYKEDEIIGENYRRFFTPEDVAAGKPERLLEIARRNGRAEDRGWRIRKDGSRFLADAVVTRLADDTGRLIGFVKVTRDVTERERALEADRERAAREQAQAMLDRVQAFAANIPGLAYRRILKPDGTIEYPFVAGQYVEQLGFAMNPVMEDGADLLAVTHPDDRARLREAFGRSAAELSFLEVEARFVLASGEVRWMRSRSTPRPGRAGAIVWDAIAFDITGQRRLEERLRLLQTTSLAVAEAEDFNSALFVVLRAVCSSGDWDYGAAWIPDRANEKLKLGPVWHKEGKGLAEGAALGRAGSIAPGEGIVGSAWQSRESLWAPDLAAWPGPQSDRVRIVLGVGVKSVCVLPIVTGDEVLAVLSFASAERRERDEGMVSTIGAVANQLGSALQRKLAEQALRDNEAQLAQLQKMEAIGSLTGGMAHDFNNLLAVIIGNLDLLTDVISSDGEARTLATEAHAAAMRGADLIRRLLAFARQQPLQPERLDVGKYVVEIATLLRRTLGEQIKIVVNVEPDAWPVIADSVQLEAAITNLATNARDAMPNGGRLTMHVARAHLDQDYASTHPDVTPGDYTVISVNDTGTGITSEVINRIFEPFFTTKEQGKGTGLGLSMVFGFIKQSGGHVSVYSEPGVGTTFRLYLPQAKADLAQTTSPAAEAETTSGRGEMILAVEDNPDLRNLLDRQLRELGYLAVFAENARTALGLLERNSDIRVLFTDVVMPGGMSGIELAREATARWPHVRVLLTSGFPEARMAHAGVGTSGPRLLSKPYPKDELARALRSALEEEAP
jgi:PAS domain S-box-containing protein